MASSKATTVDQYLAELPADRRAVISAVRDVVNANLPAGYLEGMHYGMIGWYVPLEKFPDTYNGQPIGPAALAAQKNYNALYLQTVYGDRALEAWFKAAFKKAGKKLDMGKSCVRFKKLDDLPLDVIGQTIAKVPVDKLIARYASVKGSARKARAASEKKPKRSTKKPAARKKAKQKPKPKKR